MKKADIMIAEDEAIVAEEIKTSLLSVGYSVTSIVKSGEAAIEKAKQKHPDLIIMDIHLEGHVDGIEAAIRINASLNIPIIFLTAYVDDKKLEKAKAAEPFGYLVKPFKDRELMATVEMALYKANMEAKLRESEEKFRKIAVTSQDAIIMLDNEGNISYWNEAAEKIFQHASIHVLGKDLHSLIVPERHYEAFKKGFKKFRNTGEGFVIGKRLELSAKRKDGKEIPVELSLSAVKIKDKWNAIGIIRDISEKKKAEEALEKIHQELLESSRLAGMAEVAKDILHNAGNILNSVNVSTNWIIEKLLDSKVQNLKKVTDMIEDNIEDIGTFLTKDPQGKHIPVYLTKLAKLLIDEQTIITKKLGALAGNVEHIKEIIDMQHQYSNVSGVEVTAFLKEIVENAIEINQSDLEYHGIKVKREFAEFGEVIIERHRVIQILVNLISNANHALTESEKEEKVLNIKFNKHGEDQLRIEVTDNGIGIIEENLTKIFRHGFTTKRHSHGFGLHRDALSAREMGGVLTVHSEGLEQGATFTLELPFKAVRIT
jgi:PAS domain S-box-containing protein